jgi:hypothetical protein
MNSNTINEHVNAALKLSGSKTRYSGIVDRIDRPSTTVFILSGERTFLAFQTPEKLLTGDQVTFRIDGLRAKDLRKEIPADS